MLSVCTKGLRETQFQFSVCMYGAYGRIDNKADFDFEFDVLFVLGAIHIERVFASKNAQGWLSF